VIEEREEDEADYRRLSTKELVVLVSKGDDSAYEELKRRETQRRAVAPKE
jgi:hypothetical protein